jgi:ABC-2 type transport system ATP-binding protein
VVALDGVDLAVRQGELYGVLGPNGAGKTTLIKILVTLLLPSSGSAFVDGLDVVSDFRRLRHRIAMVSGGENVGYGMLTVREQLWMFSQLYGMDSGRAYRRIDELLERVGLADAAKRRVHELSSGMRQKMTTHYMMEADELCDRLAIVNRGRIVAEGTPAALKQEVRQDTVIDLRLSQGPLLLDAMRGVEGVAAASVYEQDGSDRFSILLADDDVLPRVLALVQQSGRAVQAITKREPTLEDAFVSLVGRGMAEEESRG